MLAKDSFQSTSALADAYHLDYGNLCNRLIARRPLHPQSWTKTQGWPKVSNRYNVHAVLPVIQEIEKNNRPVARWKAQKKPRQVKTIQRD
jgi:hypothetical protein